jgi:predicted amidophosphoribosyltransferase
MEQTMPYCYNCGAEVQPGDRFCDSCRADLAAVDDEAYKRRPKQGGDTRSPGQQGPRARQGSDQHEE